MYMLVRIGQYVITNQLSGAPVSYLSQQLGNCLISVKRLFDKFIVSIFVVFLKYDCISLVEISKVIN